MPISKPFDNAKPLIMRGIEDRDWKLIEEAAEILDIGHFRKNNMACNRKKKDAPQTS